MFAGCKNKTNNSPIPIDCTYMHVCCLRTLTVKGVADDGYNGRPAKDLQGIQYIHPAAQQENTMQE